MDSVADGLSLNLLLTKWGILSMLLLAGLGTALSFVVSRARKARALQRISATSATACIVCGSEDVARDASTARCRACGYEGRADGGGEFSGSDTHGLFASTNHLQSMRETFRFDPDRDR